MHPSVSTPSSSDSAPDARLGQADLELVRGALAGDVAAGEALIRRMACAALFLNVHNRRFGSPFSREELGDIAQDAIAIVWSKLASFEGRGALEAWVYRICALEFMNALRRHARRRRSSKELDEHELPEPSSPDAYAPSDLAPLRAALLRLSQPEQDVLRLRHHEQRSFPEIAAELALPLNTVKSHYHRALARLRERLGGAYAEESP